MRFLPAIIALLLPAAAFAQQGRQMGPLDGFGLFIGAWFALAGTIVVLTFLLGPIIFWILMVIDATKRQWPDRDMWLIVLWLTLFLGLYFVSAMLYYFLVKAKDVGTFSPAAPKQKQKQKV